MSRPVAHNKVSEPISGSIVNGDDVGNIVYTVDGEGNNYYDGYADRLWVPSAEGAAPIVFVTDTFTQGYTGDVNEAVPIFFACAGTSSAAIIYTANRLPGMEGQDFGTAEEALGYVTRNGYFILEGNDPFEGINADSLAFDMDASKMSSYPQTGTTTYDLSGNIGQGSMNNGVSWVSNSGSFFFDGADDEIYVSNNTAINIAGTQQYTAMATVYPLLGGVTWHGIFSKGNLQQYALTINSPSAYLHYETNQGGVSALNSAGSTVTANRWQHFVARFDGTNKTIWKNGEIIATQAASTLNSTSNTEELRIGEGNGGENFRGEIQSVRIYRKSLTEAEIKQNYFGSPIVTDGLVFAVDANNIVSYPKSGTAWYGLTGSYSASLVNGPTFDPRNGGSIVFDGVDDQATTNAPGLATATLMAWVYPYTSSDASGLYFEGIIDNDTPGLYGTGFGPNGSTYGAILDDTFWSTGVTVDLNAWQLVAMSFNSNTAKFYKNGVEAASLSYTRGALTSTNYLIGKSNANAQYFNGRIANVKIYNRVLTASEILQNYQAEQYRFAGPQGIVTSGLIMYWDAGNLDSYPGTGTTIYDLSGNGNNGTLVNGVGFNQANGGVLTFDGIDDYVQNNTLNLAATDCTVIGISRYTSVNTGVYQGGGRIINARNNNWLMGHWDRSAMKYYAQGWVTDADGAEGMPDTNWHFYHTFNQYSTDSWSFYIDNVLDASNSNGSEGPNGFSIGMYGNNFSEYSKSNFSVLLAYNRILSAAEVTQVYNYFRGRFGL